MPTEERDCSPPLTGDAMLLGFTNQGAVKRGDAFAALCALIRFSCRRSLVPGPDFFSDC